MSDLDAIVIGAGILRRRLRRGIRRCDVMRDGKMTRSPRLPHAVEMHMPKREHDLERQRSKRQQCPVPSMAANPSHIGMLTLQCYI